MTELEFLAIKIVEKLQAKGLYLTTVESCTGGGIANTITNVVGASEVIAQAFVTYSNEAKIALGVPARIIDEHTVYSKETAAAMAWIAIAEAVKADLVIAVTGSLSRVDPANAESSQPGVIYIAVASADDRIKVEELRLGEEPSLSDDNLLENMFRRRELAKKLIIVKSLQMLVDFL
jgi:PncC family amidohydrolase